MLYPARWKNVTVDQSKVLKNQLNQLFRFYWATRYKGRFHTSHLRCVNILYSTEWKIQKWRSRSCSCYIIHTCSYRNLAGASCSDVIFAWMFWKEVFIIQDSWRSCMTLNIFAHIFHKEIKIVYISTSRRHVTSSDAMSKPSQQTVFIHYLGQ